MRGAFHPSKLDLGDRRRGSVDADAAAFEAWVKRSDPELPGRARITIARGGHVDLIELEDDFRSPVARVILRAGRWHLQWANRSDRWLDYDDKAYLTLAIPMQLIEEDPSGVFWG